jgi:hypothetical protein
MMKPPTDKLGKKSLKFSGLEREPGRQQDGKNAG